MIYGINDNGEIKRIRLCNVSQMRMNDREFVFDTPDGTYRQISTLKEAAKHAAILGFKLVNKNNLINMRHVIDYNEKTGVVTLRSGDTVKVSRSNQKFMESFMIDKM